MLKPISIVIPTYWKRKHGEPSRPGDSIFDHPTPLDGKETLSRTLSSLSKLESSSFQVIVLTATVCREIDADVEKRVQQIIDPFRSQFPIIQFANCHLNALNQLLTGVDNICLPLKLDNYSNIRNCQLAVPVACGSKVIAAIDDDETVSPDYLYRALEYLDKPVKGQHVHGKTGSYFHEWGDYLLKEPANIKNTDNIFSLKEVLINETFTRLHSSSNRLVDTPIALGGNMVFSKKLFTNVPFDPNITRGEDIDYLINAKCLGYNLLFDKKLRIDHFPPPGDIISKLQEDVIRFMYEIRKLELTKTRQDLVQLEPEQLCPYPGEFLKPKMKEHAKEILIAHKKSTTYHSESIGIHEIMEKALEKGKHVEFYFEFANQWPNLMSYIENSQETHQYVADLFSSGN